MSPLAAGQGPVASALPHECSLRAGRGRGTVDTPASAQHTLLAPCRSHCLLRNTSPAFLRDKPQRRVGTGHIQGGQRGQGASLCVPFARSTAASHPCSLAVPRAADAGRPKLVLLHHLVPALGQGAGTEAGGVLRGRPQLRAARMAADGHVHACRHPLQAAPALGAKHTWARGPAAVPPGEPRPAPGLLGSPKAAKSRAQPSARQPPGTFSGSMQRQRLMRSHGTALTTAKAGPHGGPCHSPHHRKGRPPWRSLGAALTTAKAAPTAVPWHSPHHREGRPPRRSHGTALAQPSPPRRRSTQC